MSTANSSVNDDVTKLIPNMPPINTIKQNTILLIVPISGDVLLAIALGISYHPSIVNILNTVYMDSIGLSKYSGVILEYKLYNIIDIINITINIPTITPILALNAILRLNNNLS